MECSASFSWLAHLSLHFHSELITVFLCLYATASFHFRVVFFIITIIINILIILILLLLLFIVVIVDIIIVVECNW